MSSTVIHDEQAAQSAETVAAQANSKSLSNKTRAPVYVDPEVVRRRREEKAAKKAAQQRKQQEQAAIAAESSSQQDSHEELGFLERVFTRLPELGQNGGGQATATRQALKLMTWNVSQLQ